MVGVACRGLRWPEAPPAAAAAAGREDAAGGSRLAPRGGGGGRGRRWGCPVPARPGWGGREPGRGCGGESGGSADRPAGRSGFDLVFGVPP